MKSTGIVRPIDSLGRVVLPKELRETLQISTKDPLEIFVENDKIILKKYSPCCIFCGNGDEVTYYKGKLICRDCLEALKSMLNTFRNFYHPQQHGSWRLSAVILPQHPPKIPQNEGHNLL